MVYRVTQTQDPLSKERSRRDVTARIDSAAKMEEGVARLSVNVSRVQSIVVPSLFVFKTIGPVGQRSFRQSSSRCLHFVLPLVQRTLAGGIYSPLSQLCRQVSTTSPHKGGVRLTEDHSAVSSLGSYQVDAVPPSHS